MQDPSINYPDCKRWTQSSGPSPRFLSLPPLLVLVPGFCYHLCLLACQAPENEHSLHEAHSSPSVLHTGPFVLLPARALALMAHSASLWCHGENPATLFSPWKRHHAASTQNLCGPVAKPPSLTSGGPEGRVAGPVIHPLISELLSSR